MTEELLLSMLPVTWFLLGVGVGFFFGALVIYVWLRFHPAPPVRWTQEVII